jgi:hypothetical protein
MKSTMACVFRHPAEARSGSGSPPSPARTLPARRSRLSWDEVHEEAERLEHFISEKLEDRIAAKLGDPETDPHGHPIPEKGGAVKEAPKRRRCPNGPAAFRRGQQRFGSGSVALCAS